MAASSRPDIRPLLVLLEPERRDTRRERGRLHAQQLRGALRAEDLAVSQLFQVLSGARAALDPLGVTLLRGHTATAPELLVGFSVDGIADSRGSLLRMSGLRPGDRLILTKPLGTGVLFHADGRGEARGPWIQAALASMLRSNLAAARVAREAGATAATDVTGFGLAGHLAEGGLRPPGPTAP